MNTSSFWTVGSYKHLLLTQHVQMHQPKSGRRECMFTDASDLLLGNSVTQVTAEETGLHFFMVS